MSLNFAAISPHPPLLIPEIARLQSPERSDGGQGGDNLEKISQTVQAMKKLAHLFSIAEIDTLIIISPHMLIYPDCFNIGGMKKLFGSFASFGAPDVILEYANNLELAREIDQKSQDENIKTLLYDNGGEFFELDHGLMVPMYFLDQKQDSPLKIIPLAYSNLDRASHFTFGQILGEIIKTHPGRIGILASGDLSHRLIQSAPSGFSKAGHEFDQKIVKDIKENNPQNILYYDEDMLSEAGECGYRSILILLGALDKTNVRPEILSYEGPFGVGYLVANYRL